jgi:hypothetical protein
MISRYSQLTVSTAHALTLAVDVVEAISTADRVGDEPIAEGVASSAKLRRRELGRKLDRKRWQQSAAACRRLQVAETQTTLTMPEKSGFLELRCLSQLGYGDVIVTIFFHKPLWQGKSQLLAENYGCWPISASCTCLLPLNSSGFRWPRSSPSSTWKEGRAPRKIGHSSSRRGSIHDGVEVLSRCSPGGPNGIQAQN